MNLYYLKSKENIKLWKKLLRKIEEDSRKNYR